MDNEAQPSKEVGGQMGTTLEVLGGHGAAESAAGTERPAAACWERLAHGSVQTRRSGGGRQRIPLQRRAIRSSGN